MGQPSMILMMVRPADRTIRAGVCHSVQRNRFGFGGLERAGAAQLLEPADETVAGAHEMKPGPVGVEVAEREPFQPGVLQSFDVVFDVSVSTHVRVEFDRGAGVVGVMTPVTEHRGREQGALRAGM